MASNWNPRTTVNDKSITLDDIKISFKRTIRVPDNKNVSQLPPSLGDFSLHKVSDYASKLPETMAGKGGIFLTMYQREAMWIKFTSFRPYALKILVGGVNAISGEPVAQNTATQLRRRTLLSQGNSIQDYAIIPEQRWLDGIATSPGKVRQFVAMPVGKGYTVEAQITGAEYAAGIQIEIIPAKPVLITVRIQDGDSSSSKSVMSNITLGELFDKLGRSPGHRLRGVPRDHSSMAKTIGELGIQDGAVLYVSRHARATGVLVKFLNGAIIYLEVKGHHTIQDFKTKIHNVEGIPVDDQRITFAGMELEDGRPISDYEIQDGSTVHLVLRKRGGGGGREFPPEGNEMGIAAGGFIKQAIIQDPGKYEWDAANTKVCNVQILNSHQFKAVTGLNPPKSAITAQTYAKYGYPFYSIYEEPTDVSGNFAKVQSIAQIDYVIENDVKIPVIDLTGSKRKGDDMYATFSSKSPKYGAAGVPRAPRVEVSVLNPNGPASNFRSVAEMKKDIEQRGASLF